MIPTQIDINALKETAVFKESFSLKKTFNELEMTEMKHRLSEMSLQRQYRKDIAKKMNDLLSSDASKDAIMDSLELISDFVDRKFQDQGLKTLDSEISKLLVLIENGAEEVNTVLYAFDYQDENVMAFYDGDGVLQLQRPLMPQERQQSLFSIKTLTSNG